MDDGDEDAPGWVRALRHPAGILGLGLVAFPVAKLLWIPNYIFNFLATLVHECGHAACAWLQGRASIPTISIGGGGVTIWGEPHASLCVLVLAALGWLIVRVRENKVAAGALGVVAFLYIGVAFFDAEGLFPTAGGILFEIGGAGACFFTALALDLERPFERPLYALWGWWMLLNRMGETWLMLRSAEHWDAQRVYESGLAAGLVNDLHQLVDGSGLRPTTVLVLVFAACLLTLPAAAGLAWLWRRRPAA